MTTDPHELQDRLLNFVQAELLNSRGELAITPTDDLLGTELIDSLGVMRLVQHIEEQYRIKIPPADVTIENFMTISKISSYLEERLAHDGQTADS